MTDEQIAGRLKTVRSVSVSLHGGGYSYESGAPSEACWDVRWLLEHIDGLGIAAADKDRRIAELEGLLDRVPHDCIGASPVGSEHCVRCEWDATSRGKP